MPRLKEVLRGKYLCDGQHQHWVLNDAKSTKASRVYPKKFQQLVAREIQATINDHRQDPMVRVERRRHSKFEVNPHKIIYNRGATGVSFNYPTEAGIEEDIHVSDDEEEAVDEGEPEQDQGDQAEDEEVRRNDEAASKTMWKIIKVVMKDVTDRQKYLVKQVHRHMGHLPKEALIRSFKNSKALPEVLRYIQDEFKCEECEATARPPVRRKIAAPRTFSFNRILSIDTFFVTLGGQPVPIQCVICQGTHYVVLSIVYSHHSPDQEETHNLLKRE